MPIPKDQFRDIDDEGPPQPDLAPDTTQGRVYRFLLAHADQAFRQREIIEAVEVPPGSVGPTLARLEEQGLVDHRARFWAIADDQHARAAAGLHGIASADDIDGGFADVEVDRWMQTADEPIRPNGDRDDTA